MLSELWRSWGRGAGAAGAKLRKARLEDVDFEVGVAGHEVPVLESYDEEMAVLVSDLQGFTSTVRACGAWLSARPQEQSQGLKICKMLF